jgi:LTXXQ motif family protein
MRSCLLLLAALVAVPAAAQNPTPGQGPGGPGRQFTPPPDHWMTMDSLTAAVGLTAAQKTKVTQAYTALNAVMKQAADRRAAIRGQMQGQFTPGQEPTPEQRARMDSVRAEFEGMQEEANQWLGMIRAELTAEQQAKFDALPPPRVAMRMRRPGN